jgi:hypothetical protein
MAGPGIVVVAALFTAWIAATTSDPLVDEEYYKKGLALSQRAADKLAATSGPRAEIAVGADSRVRIFLNGSVPQAALLLRIVPLDPALNEQTLTLRMEAPGLYVAAMPNVPRSGKWRAILEAQDKSWKMEGEWQPSREEALHLAPATPVS